MTTARAVQALFVAASLAVPALPQAPASQPAPEASLPIHQDILHDRSRRFSVPIRVGSQELEAGLDTGSVGLHVLDYRVSPSQYQATSEPTHYGYGSGVAMLGVKVAASVSLGAIQSNTTFQLVQSIHCMEGKPNCPASRVPYQQYGLMGDGIPGAGFPAILGIKPNDDAPVPNVFTAFGITRWVVAVPNERERGQLVLNPSSTSLAGFVTLPVFAGPHERLHDAVHGCIQNDLTQERICGAIEMDSGAPGISVTSPNPLPQAWRPGIPASLLFQDAEGKTRAVEHFRTDQRPAMSHLTFQQKADARYTVIHAGPSPYLCFSVLYDTQTNMLGFAARKTGSDEPHAELR